MQRLVAGRTGIQNLGWRQVEHFLPIFCHIWWFFKDSHCCLQCAPLWKIIKYDTNLVKMEEKPCSTSLKCLNPYLIYGTSKTQNQGFKHSFHHYRLPKSYTATTCATRFLPEIFWYEWEEGWLLGINSSLKIHVFFAVQKRIFWLCKCRI